MKTIQTLLLTIGIGFCIGCIYFPLYASATEIVQNESVTCPYDGHVYGEIEDGLFVRNMAEEMENIPKDAADYFTEYEKALNSHKLGYLTPEMEAAGYFLQESNGLVYTASEKEGDAGEGANVTKLTGDKVSSGLEVESFDENGNPIVDWNKGYVSFVATVHPDIHEVCFVEVTNINSSKTYSFELYEQNGFNKGIQLPSGSYTVSGGGIREDYTMKYPINNPAFEVVAGSPTVVNITIGNLDEQAMKEGITIPLNESENNDDVVNDNEIMKQKKEFPFIRTLFYLGLGLCCAFLIHKYIKKRR